MFDHQIDYIRTVQCINLATELNIYRIFFHIWYWVSKVFQMFIITSIFTLQLSMLFWLIRINKTKYSDAHIQCDNHMAINSKSHEMVMFNVLQFFMMKLWFFKVNAHDQYVSSSMFSLDAFTRILSHGEIYNNKVVYRSQQSKCAADEGNRHKTETIFLCIIWMNQ